MLETPVTVGAGKPLKDKSQRKTRKPLSDPAFNRRIAAIQQMEDKEKAKKALRRLQHSLLAGIAEGAIAHPAKAAQAFLALAPRKKAAEAGDN